MQHVRHNHPLAQGFCHCQAPLRDGEPRRNAGLRRELGVSIHYLGPDTSLLAPAFQFDSVSLVHIRSNNVLGGDGRSIILIRRL